MFESTFSDSLSNAFGSSLLTLIHESGSFACAAFGGLKDFLTAEDAEFAEDLLEDSRLVIKDERFLTTSVFVRLRRDKDYTDGHRWIGLKGGKGFNREVR